MMGSVGHVIDRAIERLFVCARRLRKSGKLPNELERRRANLFIRRSWRKIMQGLNGSTHTGLSTLTYQPATIFAFVVPDTEEDHR